jgi:hypothetical protein
MTGVPGSFDMRLTALPMLKSASFIEAMPPYPV